MNAADLSALPKRCQDARHDLDLSYRMAAAKIGITSTSLYNFEHGSNVGFDKVIRIAEWLEVIDAQRD